ncbi:MAG: ADP-ribosylglycohydrolase family protein [Myxococcota bacterium]
MTADDRVAGGLVGLLVGDALGVPYEFHDPRNLPPPEQIELEPPPDFRRSHRGVPPGTWSDDGAQALALLDSLLGRPPRPRRPRAALPRLVAPGRLRRGRATLRHRQPDLRRAAPPRAGRPRLAAGGTGERDNGNGSLMRVLPLALWHRGDDAALVRDAHAQSRITHGHPRSGAACALYCLWARAELAGRTHDDALAQLRRLYADDPVHAAELEGIAAPFPARGTGYVVDCLHSARVALEEPTYERVVRRAVAFGLDTDTTAAVAGGIAGLRHGLGAIPQRWRDGLRGGTILEPLLARLRAHLASE